MSDTSKVTPVRSQQPAENTAVPKLSHSDHPIQTISGALATKQIGKYQVTVIRDKCISAASCVAIAPGVFQLDEEQLAVVISQDGADDEMKLLAAQSCPTMAIIVVDTETGQQVWPVE